ncbi:2-oxoglutarate dehydrogenase, E2 component, dihydrolipoamide succinyltransferase [Georgenia yuyongxinii]
MSESVKMPALGESVTEGTVTRWLKAVGESVEVDEPLLEVSTDKVDTEVPSPVAGVVEKILVEEDETVEVGAELVVIGDGTGGGEPADDAEPATTGEPDTAPTTATAAPASEAVEAAQPTAAASPEEAKAEATQNAPSDGGAPSGEAVKMPALGESVTEGTVTRWLKAEGETVEVDEPLLEVSTDKVDTEVPSPVAGTVLKILVQEDETVDVGADLAIVGQAGAAAAPKAEAPAAAAPKAEAPAAAAPQAEAPAAAAPTAEAPQAAAPARAEAAPAAAGTAYITPLVRKLAAEKGIDLSTVTGTGVGGRIRKQDVEAAAEKAAAQAAPAPTAAPAAAPAKQPAPVEVSPLRGTTEKMSRLRKVIAKRMRESLDTSTQLTSVMEVDVTRVATLRARAKTAFQAAEGTKLTFLPFFVKAATEALKAHPKLNATIDGDNVIYHGAEHIGIAVDTPRGLLVPVIRDAGDLTIGGIAKKISDLAARTRDSKVTPDELSGSTFTITNTGSAGLLIDTPIINQPEVAIMGVGTIVKRPAVVKDAEGNDTIGIRSIIYLSLTYDHRLVDGADAGRYLSAVKARLEEGAFEAEVGL